MKSIYLVSAVNIKANIDKPLAGFSTSKKAEKYVDLMNNYDYNKKRFGEDVKFVTIGIPFDRM